MAKRVVFIDLEVSTETRRVKDYGAAYDSVRQLHTASASGFSEFVSGADFICGHNIINHDLQYCSGIIRNRVSHAIDTLYMSPLMFPGRPYHRLLKDDKLQTEQLNNPLNDAIKAMELFYDEVNAYEQLPLTMKHIYQGLLRKDPHFEGFFDYVGYQFTLTSLESIIRKTFAGSICANADISMLIGRFPVELAYALAIISTNDRFSITPPWVNINYPNVGYVIRLLRENQCAEGCEYCAGKLDVKKKLKDIFGYDSFRTYNGEPLQEKAARAAVDGKSLLAIFPTGGGKSITFQLPALISGETQRGLTVVISPLQSLMKDQVDNLAAAGVVDAVTINGLLNNIERAEAIERVASGLASILYISPESLRSNTVERLLLSRNVVRFVIDEAHCFSAWGQDFRVDYLYIGDFIKKYNETKKLPQGIPVSCFTATAKQKVISDISDYFRKKLGIELELFATNATRTNLHYSVLFEETEEEKYTALRSLIEQKNCPTIVYVSRTRRTHELARKLTADGFPAMAFNGKMENSEKIGAQEAFIGNDVQVIVATSAFGMGVDKKDVGLVVHYDISDSLENYVQEAGRAGRDQSISAECYVLFNENDLDKHFILLNQTKLSISEIQQVWKAVKDLTKTHSQFSRSALEIARQAGWDDSGPDVETRVKTAIAALENAGYVERGNNYSFVYADSIMVRNMEEAVCIIDGSDLLNEQQKQTAKRIIKCLISSRSKSKAGTAEAEDRVDYLADILGLSKDDVLTSISLMREIGLLDDCTDMTAYLKKNDTENKSHQTLVRFYDLEKYMVSVLSGEIQNINYKELNDNALKQGIKGATVRNIKTILYYWTIRKYIKKNTNVSNEQTVVTPSLDIDKITRSIDKRCQIGSFVVQYLFQKVAGRTVSPRDEVQVQFSIHELEKACPFGCTVGEVEDALLYLSKIDAICLEGGFLVLYNTMTIRRLIMDNKIKYKVDDYEQLNEFYKQRIQQIHIVGEYAKMMVKDYDEALQFVSDYFQMEYKAFISKYFKGSRNGEINRNISPEKYNKLFGSLSETQADIIRDDKSQNIVVIAGPGSGKTMVLVHKLASLLLLEDVKSEQLLMLTFSRAAATEFKSRLMALIGNAAHFVEIKTFHSYCFDLLGKIGNLVESENIVPKAADMINSGEVEIGRITKTVLVIDEAQDMDCHEFALVKALMSRNEEMRVIAVGDDDQNIYKFRGSDSGNLRTLLTEHGAKLYEMLDNYRSAAGIVSFANAFAKSIPNRMKSEPIHAISNISGVVELIHHEKCSIETAVVEQVSARYRGEKTCILTATNDEALRVMGLLTEKGMRAKLIQSNDGFDLYNLAEIRYFTKNIDRESTTPIVSDEVWQRSVEKLKSRYADSACLPLVLRMISTFESLNSNKYRSDFAEFISESKLEDFYDVDNATIVVSTIHKAKGREFDVVYMALGPSVNYKDEQMKRALYVGFTRAKQELYVHYTGNYFDSLKVPGTVFRNDTVNYPEPRQITLQLTHKDVNLGFFKYVKSTVLKLCSGSSLIYSNGDFYAEEGETRKKVAQLSKHAADIVGSLEQKGYRITSSEVRFIVAWKGEDDENESAVVLPGIRLKKRQ